jgi:hypothetical protein
MTLTRPLPTIPWLRACAKEARRVKRKRAGRKAVEVIVEFGSDILSSWP